MFDLLKKNIQSLYPLTDEDCEHFRGAFTERSFKKNEVWTVPGQICRELAFVTRGAFRIYYLHEGKEVNVHFFFEKEFAAVYSSFLSQTPSTCYLESLEDTEVILFSSQKLNEVYDASHNWERFGRIIAEACYLDAMKRAESFLFLNGEQRYLELVKNKPELLRRVPLYHIASYIGLERESLSRLRRKLAKGNSRKAA